MSLLRSGLGGGALALAGCLRRRYANSALCPATPIGVGERVFQPVVGGIDMRHPLARPEQSQSPSPQASRKLEREIESLQQQRADLVRALAAAEASVRTFPIGSLQQTNARARVTRLQRELRRLKAALGTSKRHQDVGDFLIEMFRERVSFSEWQCIVAEARRRHDSKATEGQIGTFAAGPGAQS